MAKLKIKKIAYSPSTQDKNKDIETKFDYNQFAEFFITPDHKSTGNLEKDFKFLYEAIRRRITYTDFHKRILPELKEEIKEFKQKVYSLEKQLKNFEEEKNQDK